MEKERKVFYYIWNNYVGKIELGAYTIETENGNNEGVFLSLSDAIKGLFDFIKEGLENGNYSLAKEYPKSKFTIEQSDTSKKPSKGEEFYSKVVYTITAKEILDLHEINRLKKGGAVGEEMVMGVDKYSKGTTIVDVSKLGRYAILYIPIYDENSVMKFSQKVVIAQNSEEAKAQILSKNKRARIMEIKKLAKGSTIKGKSAFTFEGLDKRFQKLDWRDTTEAYYGLDLTPFMSVVEEYIEQSGKSSQGLDSHFEKLGWRDTTEAYYGLDFTPFMSEIENYATSKYAKGSTIKGNGEKLYNVGDLIKKYPMGEVGRVVELNEVGHTTLKIGYDDYVGIFNLFAKDLLEKGEWEIINEFKVGDLPKDGTEIGFYTTHKAVDKIFKFQIIAPLSLKFNKRDDVFDVYQRGEKVDFISEKDMLNNLNNLNFQIKKYSWNKVENLRGGEKYAKGSTIKGAVRDTQNSMENAEHRKYTKKRDVVAEMEMRDVNKKRSKERIAEDKEYFEKLYAPMPKFEYTIGGL